jgi:hypothetical protein
MVFAGSKPAQTSNHLCGNADSDTERRSRVLFRNLGKGVNAEDCPMRFLQDQRSRLEIKAFGEIFDRHADDRCV